VHGGLKWPIFKYWLFCPYFAYKVRSYTVRNRRMRHDYWSIKCVKIRNTMRNIEQYKEVLFDTKSFDEVLYQVSESLGASADKAATVYGPGPSAHCRQVISTPLWHVRVVLSSKWREWRLIRPPPLFFVVGSGSDDPLSVMSKSLHWDGRMILFSAVCHCDESKRSKARLLSRLLPSSRKNRHLTLDCCRL